MTPALVLLGDPKRWNRRVTDELSNHPNLLILGGEVEFFPEHYRGHAARCMALAQRVSDISAKLELIAMAEAWQELARLGEGGPTTANGDPPSGKTA